MGARSSIVVQGFRTEVLPCAIIIGLVSLACLPLLLYGPQAGHSVTSNLSWSAAFSQQVFSGELYPRWLLDMNAGAGSPVFFFYGPVSFYLTTLAAALFGESPALVQLGIGQWIAIAGSALAFFFYVRQYAGCWTALAGALLYSLAPYHFAVDVLVRQAMGEASAFIWLPLLLLCIDRIVQGKAAGAWLSLNYALLVMSHLPSALLLSPFLLGYLVIRTGPEHQVRSVCRFMFYILLGLMLSACYLLPAIFSQPHISTEHLWGAYFDYRKWFLLDGEVAPNKALENQLLQITLLNSAVFLPLYFLALRLLNAASRSLLYALGLFFLGSWLLLTPVSAVLWDALPVLQKVQFPWRILLLQEFAVVVLVVLVVACGLTSRRRILVQAGTAGFLVLYVGGAWQAWNQYDRHLSLLQDSVQRSKLASALEIGVDTREYLPAAVKVHRKELVNYLATIEPVLYEPVAGKVEVEHWSPRHIRLTVDLQQGSPVVLKQFYFPGWQAQNLVTGEAMTLAALPTLGLIQFHAPAGSYDIELVLGALWQERLGWWLSAAGLMLFFFTLFFGRRGVSAGAQQR